MNVALIFGGGTGQRMHSGSTPKQFLNMKGKPIIAYTMDIFENHEQVDAMVMVCLESWIPTLRKIVKRYDFTKVAAIVPGGSTGQESIWHGLEEIHRRFGEDAVVLIHDAVRPLVDVQTITNNIASVYKNGNGITVVPAIETIVLKDAENNVGEIVDRKDCLIARAPQSFFVRDIYAAHQKAQQENRSDFIDSACMMKHYGARLYTVPGNVENIKITTPSDYYIMGALLDTSENSAVFC